MTDKTGSKVLASERKRLAERLLQCAEAVGSVNQLAQLAGVAQSTMRYFISSGDLPVSKLQIIARVAKIPVESLLCGRSDGSYQGGVASGSSSSYLESYKLRLRNLLREVGGANSLSAATGISLERATQIESGDLPTLEELGMLAQCAAVSLRSLLSGSAAVQAAVETDTDLMTAFVRRVQSVDENRGADYSPEAADPARQVASRLAYKQAVFDLLSELYEHLPLSAYTIHYPDDSNLLPLVDRGDWVVIDRNKAEIGMGFFLLRNLPDSGNEYIAYTQAVGDRVRIWLNTDTKSGTPAEVARSQVQCLGKVVLVVRALSRS